MYQPEVEKPDCFNVMDGIARKISRDIPFLRVDFMLFGSRPYLGEMTFFPAGGYVQWSPREWDDILSGYLGIQPGKLLDDDE